MVAKTYFEVYDEVTNKTLHILATSMEEALYISESLDFNDFVDGQQIQTT
jgi:hypothetical protein